MSVNHHFEEDKFHVTELRISLAKLKHNLNVFSSLLHPNCKIMLMIKAYGYGHDSSALAKAFQSDERIGYFAIAYTDEGVQLRESGIEKPVLILNPSPSSFSSIIANCLEPEIHNMELLKAFIEFLQEHKTEGSAYPIHLKFNTGMNRLGFDYSEIDSLIDLLKQQSVVRVQSMMTHLSSANMPEEDEFTNSQISEFEKIIAETTEIQSDTCFFHCLNSSGIYRFPSAHMQMVRLGIGFYGTSSIPQLKEKLQPSALFVSRISQIRKVKKGASISYSRSGRATEDTQIATLSLGYADGFNRRMGNGNWQVEINGKLYPTIGNICMGLTMIDIGNASLKIGDEAIIFGGQKTVYDYAKVLNTITYEVMCSIGPRVKRVITA